MAPNSKLPSGYISVGIERRRVRLSTVVLTATSALFALAIVP